MTDFVSVVLVPRDRHRGCLGAPRFQNSRLLQRGPFEAGRPWPPLTEGRECASGPAGPNGEFDSKAIQWTAQTAGLLGT